jgi:putative hydrolase of HD superfamily
MTIYQFLTICDNLKRVPRTGWLLRGIPPSAVENVAGHSHTTTILAYLLAKQVNQEVDFTRLLLMALFHDLPEAEIGDIPISAQRADPSLLEAKEQAENLAMKRILNFLPKEIHSFFLDTWKEYLKGETLEARLVEAADRLATAVHAVELIKSGYPSQRFTPFINHAETTLAELQLSIANDLVAELRKTVAYYQTPMEK